MGKLKIRRSDLCDVIREKSKCTREEQKRHVENYVLNLVQDDDSSQQAAKRVVTEFCSQYHSKMQKSNLIFSIP